jgi:hypothetical protein
VVIDREQAVAAWRQAEARVYPSVMVNAALYEQYLTAVRAVAEELGDVRTEDDLVVAWHERIDLAEEVLARLSPSMRSFMDLAALRGSAFAHRHRQITREQAKQIAADRLERARMRQSEWVVLFEDVTPLGSQRLEMHVKTGRALHASSKMDLDDPIPRFELEVVQLDPANGAWLIDQAPLMPPQTFHSHEEWEARIAQARTTFGKGHL